MLLVDARVGPSSIHGLGLIARQVIPQGEAISKFAPGLDLSFSQEELDALPEVARRNYRYYSFRHVHSRQYVLSFDDDRFMNHANDPNSNGRTALRPIAPGEEITYDYRKWDLDCEWKLEGTPGAFALSLDPAGDPDARLAVLWIVSQVGVTNKTLVPRIAEALTDPQREIRYYAAKSLSKLGPDAAPAAAALEHALGDADADIRYYAAKTLFKIGDAAKDAGDALLRALDDPHEKVRYYCGRALASIGVANARGSADQRSIDQR